MRRGPKNRPIQYIITEKGCWEVISHHRSKDGYAVIGHGTQAHRWIWEQEYGPIPDGIFVCHHCDNPPCINPEHLFLGTNTDNMQDASRKGRIRNGRARLTIEQKRAIKRRHERERLARRRQERLQRA